MPIQKVYIAAPFGSKTINIPDRQYGEIIDKDYIGFLEAVETILIHEGFKVHLPHRDTNQWGKVYHEPSFVVNRNWEEIQNCDILVAFPKKSRGVHIEIGWASALQKTIILALEDNEEASEVALALDSITEAIMLRFSGINDLREKLPKALGRKAIPKEDRQLKTSGNC